MDEMFSEGVEEPEGFNVSIPGRDPIEIRHLVFDFNGTLANGGCIESSTLDALELLLASNRFDSVTCITSDTFGTARELLGSLTHPGVYNDVETLTERPRPALHLEILRPGVPHSEGKAQYVTRLGAEHCACFGNGANDVGMSRIAALSICVLQSDGCACCLIGECDIMVKSILDGIALVQSERLIRAALRV